MKKRTLKFILSTVVFGVLAATASAHQNLWIQTSGMTSNLSSAKGASGQSKQVTSQTYRDGDEWVKKTIEVTTENGVKTTKITEERRKDGHTNVTTQVKTEKLENPKCCGMKKLKKLKKWLQRDKNQSGDGDCCGPHQDDQDNGVLEQDESTSDEHEDAAREDAARDRAARERARQIMAQKIAQKIAKKMAQHQKNIQNQAKSIQSSIHDDIQKNIAALDQEIQKLFGMV